MRNLRMVVVACMLLLPGCTYLDSEESKSEDTTEIEVEMLQGCTDSEANNFDENAEEDDGSCEYDEPEPEPEFGLSLIHI